ncbi:MAG: ABC transporter permease [Actinomycetes bacterium]
MAEVIGAVAQRADPSWWSLLAALSLVGVAVAFSIVQRLDLERTLVWAALRAGVQLALIGVALHLVLGPGRSLWLGWLWVAVMVLFAAWTNRQRAPEVPGAFALGAVAYVASLTVTLGVLFGGRVFPVEARTLVPLSGMVVGNSLACTVLVGRRVTAELRDRRDEVEARLALGMTSADAAHPFLRSAVRTALVPQIETTKAVGIVYLPGAMVGLILAGADPQTAVKVQLAVMYLMLGAVATSTSVMGVGLIRRLFTPDHRLTRLPPPE